MRASSASARTARRAVPAAGSRIPRKLAVGPRAGQLRVAEHERPQPGAPRLGLGAQDLDQGDRLRRRAEQEPVDVRGAAADARARELEPEVAQRGRDRLAHRGRLGVGLPVERAQHPVLEQDDPVVEVGRPAVGLAARCAGRERQVRGAEEAHAGRGEPRVPALEVGPRHLRRVVALARAVAQARHDPLPEIERALVAVVEQPGDELAEAGLVLVEPARLPVQRLGQPRQLLIRGEVAVADHGRSRHLEVHRAEQCGVELGLLGRELVGRRRGQADHMDLVAELLEHRADDVSPERREVVALVEDDRAEAGGAQRVHAAPCARREQIAEAHPAVRAAGDLALEARHDAGDLPRAAAGGGARPRRGLGGDRGGGLPGRAPTLLRPAGLRRRPERRARILELGERLVGQAGDRCAGAIGDEPGRGAERGAGRRPLLLDGRVGREHQRGPAQAAEDLEAEQRLARAGRGDQVGGAAPGVAVALEGLEREHLVVPPGAVETESVHGGDHRRSPGTAHDDEFRRPRESPRA